MSWIEKGRPSPFDDKPIEGLYFLNGDAISRILHAPEIEGQKYQAKRSGGASDCNYFSLENIIIIDGLGAIGGHLHTKEEYIKTTSLQTRSEALSHFLQKLNTKS